MQMTSQSHLLLTKYNGTFTAEQARDEGFESKQLSRLVQNNLIQRVAPGIYTDPAQLEDSYLIAQLRFAKGVFCDETALSFYDMTDKTPGSLEMNFSRGYHARQLENENIHASYQIDRLWRMGITTASTIYGNEVQVYSPERTICDIVRARQRIEAEVVRNALQAFAQRRDKDLNLLMVYAAELRVEQAMTEYIGVLL